jgi:hypothetical protein
MRGKEPEIKELLSKLESDEGFSVFERPSSQMSYLGKFLIESCNCQHGSLESEEEDVEDNRGHSIASSKSSLSEFSIHIFVKDINILTQESSPLQVVLVSSSTSVPASKD